MPPNEERTSRRVVRTLFPFIRKSCLGFQLLRIMSFFISISIREGKGRKGEEGDGRSETGRRTRGTAADYRAGKAVFDGQEAR